MYCVCVLDILPLLKIVILTEPLGMVVTLSNDIRVKRNVSLFSGTLSSVTFTEISPDFSPGLIMSS